MMKTQDTHEVGINTELGHSVAAFLEGIVHLVFPPTYNETNQQASESIQC